MVFDEILQKPEPRLNEPEDDGTRAYRNKLVAYRVHRVLLHEYDELFGDSKIINTTDKTDLGAPEKITARMLGPIGCHIINTPFGTGVSYRHVNIEALAADPDEFFEFTTKLWKSIFSTIATNFEFENMRDVGNTARTTFCRVLVSLNYFCRGVIRYAFLYTVGFFERFDAYFTGEYGLTRMSSELIAYEYCMQVAEEMRLMDALSGPTAYMRHCYNAQKYEKEREALEERYAKSANKKSENFFVRLGKVVCDFFDDPLDKDSEDD